MYIPSPVACPSHNLLYLAYCVWHYPLPTWNTYTYRYMHSTEEASYYVLPDHILQFTIAPPSIIKATNPQLLYIYPLCQFNNTHHGRISSLVSSLLPHPAFLSWFEYEERLRLCFTCRPLMPGGALQQWGILSQHTVSNSNTFPFTINFFANTC